MPGTEHELPESISRDNAEQYSWGERCLGWPLLRNASLSVIEEMMPPGTAEQIHRHYVAQQFFYILSGEAVMEFANNEVALKEGQGVTVNPGVPHRIRNLSKAEARFLVISQPSTKNGDRENLNQWPGNRELAARPEIERAEQDFKTENK